MLGKCFFLVESHNPDLPTENYDELVYDNSTAGNYSTILDWGKYKIVFSGGGGSGSAVARAHTSNVTINSNNPGTNGEEKILMINVGYGATKTFSGVIGEGGKRSYARATDTHDEASAGAGGAGYANGGNGSAKHDRFSYGEYLNVSYGIASGAGGGSTSLVIDGTLNSIAVGGNGGSCKITATVVGAQSRTGGTGGNGGTTTGTGAAGGAAKAIYAGAGYSTAGSDGYIKIYKSNLKPEPV